MALGAAAGDAVAQQIAQRIETDTPQRPPLRFINKKPGTHPFRARDMGKRPNIFLITLDMVGPDLYHPSRALNKEMDVPAIRALFDDSVVFNNAFCVAPLCAPARAGLATGRYTYITANGERAHDGIETILRSSDVIFQEYLKATGYKTKHVGKGHLGTQKFMDAFDENDNAWDRWAPPIYDDEAYLAYLKRLGVKNQRYRKEITGLQQDRKTPGNSLGGWLEQRDGKRFPLEAQYSYHLAQRAIEKLDAALADNDGAHPVYLQMDIFDPHQPFSIPDGFQEQEKHLRATDSLPASYEAVRARDFQPAANEPKVYGFYRKYWGLYNPTTLRDYRVANALQVTTVDRALASFIRALKQRNLYDEAIIIFTSDHGEMNGRQALVDKGVYLFPDVLRVPLSIKMPASYGMKHKTVDAPVSHLDIAPTLLGIAGVEPEERLDGRTLLPHLNGTAVPADRELFFKCGWHVGINFACGVQKWERTGAHHLYSYNLSSPDDELYDLAAVDAENLASKPENAKLHLEMINRLGAFLERDARYIGYRDSFRIDHYFDLPKQAGDRQMFRPV